MGFALAFFLGALTSAATMLILYLSSSLPTSSRGSVPSNLAQIGIESDAPQTSFDNVDPEAINLIVQSIIQHFLGPNNQEVVRGILEEKLRDALTSTPAATSENGQTEPSPRRSGILGESLSFKVKNFAVSQFDLSMLKIAIAHLSLHNISQFVQSEPRSVTHLTLTVAVSGPLLVRALITSELRIVLKEFKVTLPIDIAFKSLCMTLKVEIANDLLASKGCATVIGHAEVQSEAPARTASSHGQHTNESLDAVLDDALESLRPEAVAKEDDLRLSEAHKEQLKLSQLSSPTPGAGAAFVIPQLAITVTDIDTLDIDLTPRDTNDVAISQKIKAVSLKFLSSLVPKAIRKILIGRVIRVT